LLVVDHFEDGLVLALLLLLLDSHEFRNRLLLFR
jgi:hypothetical protein